MAMTQHQTASAEGLSIEYEVRGQGEPAIVLVHGWAFDRHLWDEQVPRLAQRHRVAAIDLPGHGQSGRERTAWTIAAFGRDVKGVIDELGAAQVVLVGHSMGGLVVLEAARLLGDRLRGVVLVDIVLDAEKRMPPEQVEGMIGELRADYPGVTRRMASEHLVAPATPAAVRERILRHALAVPVETSLSLLRAVWTYDPRPALRDINAPIRAVNADKFPTSLEVNRRHMPGYEATILEGTAHYLMLEDPERFGAALEKAIGQVLAAPR
jgi:pimeloyl-ACP methyl ester carboxylesterase